MTALSEAREEEMLRQIAETGSLTCILAPVQSSFDGEGRILVSRNGLRQFLHRRLYAAAIFPPPALLYRYCATWGCQNPWHFTNRRPSPSKCRNGHVYRQQDRGSDGKHRCGRCRDKRNAARRQGGEAHWEAEKKRMYCPYNHEYTPENTYLWKDPRGYTHRKCKTCTLIRRAGDDPLLVRLQEIDPW